MLAIGGREALVVDQVAEHLAVGEEGEPVVALAAALRRAVAGRDTTLIRAPLSWSGELWPIRGPLDFLGYDGGGGIGSGPGMAVGAALALMSAKRLPVAVIGDGDLLMGVTALWTAARYRIPVLIIVANNRSFYNDELHQERVARQRAVPAAFGGRREQDERPRIDGEALAGLAQHLLGADDRWTDPAAMMDPARSVGQTPEARRLPRILLPPRMLRRPGRSWSASPLPKRCWRISAPLSYAPTCRHAAGSAGPAPAWPCSTATR